MRWPDFSKYGGMKLVVAALPSGHRKLIMMNGDRYPVLLSAIGFQKHGKFWMRDSLRFNADDFKRVFPQMYIRNITEDQILYRWDMGNSQEAIATKIALLSANPIGMNARGETVHDGADGRFIKLEDGTAVVETLREPRFLGVRKAVSKQEAIEDLGACLDGMVEEIVRGRVFRSDDMARLIDKVIEGRDDITLDEAYGGISGALLRRMRAGSEEPGDEAYRLSVKLHEGLPPLDQELEKSIIPLPLGVAVQRILGKLQGSVATNCAENGAFVSVNNGSVDIIDGNDIAIANLTRAGVNAKASAEDARYDAIAAGLYGRALDRVAKVRGAEFRRGDHVGMLEMLDRRRDGGRSVFILGVDEGQQQGLPGEETRRLLDHLSTRYSVESVVELDGALFGRSGFNSNRLMVVVGDRRPGPAKAFEEVEVVRDYGRLWAVAEGILVARNEASTSQNAGRVLDENGYQAPYVAVSQVGESESMIPRNLVGPTRKALAKVEERHGDIDLWVAGCLQVDLSELGTLLSAEQVDAVALIIDAHQRGKGFVIGDQTGVGKGRVLAALTRYAALNGMPTIFLTEKKGLFSDFWRDIEDTGTSSLVKPFVLNQGVPIVDLEKRRLFRGNRKEEVQAFMDWTHTNGGMMSGVNLVMATYSQFNKSSNDRSRWLKDAAHGALVILDESHIAAGEDSATGENIRSMLAEDCDVIYSSATYAKDTANQTLYSRIFPDTINPSEIQSVLASGGEALQEVFTSMLAEDGVFIRRELDLSDVTFETVHDDVHLAENEVLADKFADVLEILGRISQEVRAYINDENERIKERVDQGLAASAAANKTPGAPKVRNGRLGLYSMNFGSRLYSVLRQFMTAISAEEALRIAIEDIEQGRKPVVVVEQTNEALLKDFIKRTTDANTELEELAALAALGDNAVDEEEEEEVGEVIEFDQQVMNEPLQFREILRRLADKVAFVGGVNAKGEEVSMMLESDTINQAKEALETLIDAFPDLHASPIDLIRDGLAARGYTSGELSGRGISISEVVDMDGKYWVIRPPQNASRNDVIHGYNNGAIDALVITAAGSTGISLHASARFLDQRQRSMIELQIANNVATRMQFLGRVNRKGQVCPPLIRTLTSGLPSQNRLLSMQNTKLRRLSANTTSNRDSAVQTTDFPDILNVVGSEVCRRYMENNLELPRRLAIDVDKLSEEAAKKMGDKIWYVNQLTARLGMLHVSEARRVFDDLDRDYQSRLLELDAAGTNPFRSNELDLNATVVDRDIFEGVELEQYPSTFDLPVYQSTIEFEEKFTPIRSSVVQDLMSVSINQARMDGTYGAGLSHLVPVIEGRRHELYEKCLSQTYISVAEALLDPKRDNAVKGTQDRLDKIVKLLPLLEAGNLIRLNYMGESVIGVITKASSPDVDRLHMASWYEVKTAWPGCRSVHTWPLSQIMHDESLHIWKPQPHEMQAVMQQFDNMASSSRVRRRALLDGNIFSAAQISSSQKIGMPVIYTDNYGVRQRGILLPGEVYSKRRMIDSQPRLRSLEETLRVVREGIPDNRAASSRRARDIHALTTSPNSKMDEKTDCMIYRSNNNWREKNLLFCVPHNVTSGGQFLKDPGLKAICGQFRTVLGMKVAIIPVEREEAFFRYWYEHVRVGLYATSNMRDLVNTVRKDLATAETSEAPKVAA